MTRLFIALALAFAGCASSLDARFTTQAAPGEDVLAQRLERAPPRRERAVVVAVTKPPTQLVAFDLEKNVLLWQTPSEADSAPLLAGNSVVVQERDGVVVRDLATGAVRATLKDEGRLVSADGAGELVALSIGHGEGSPRGTVALVDGTKVRFRRTLGQPVGSVALVGEYVLVPWASQRLTVLSAVDGEELMRWTFPTQSVGQARVVGESVYFGQHALSRVTAALPGQRENPPPGYVPQKRVLPGQPPALRDGYAPLPRLDSAEQRVALSFQLAEGLGEARAEHDLLALRFYRLVFGLAAGSDGVRWVQVMERDQVAAQVSPAGLWLVDDAGSVRLLDASGGELTRAELGTPVLAAAIRGLTTAPVVPPDAARASAALSTLHDQLLAAARLEDDRLVLARAYAVELLARSTDARVTGELIELCGKRDAPEPMKLAACQRLSAREQGKQEVLAALRTRGSFLEDTTPPPVGALAQAAARMGLVEAGNLLVTHAENPGTRVADLPAIFQALEQLEHRAAGPTLERFVRLHHGEPQGSELSPALSAAISALGALRARTARATLEDVAQDELGTKRVRDEAQKALLVLDTPPASKQQEPDKNAKVAEPAAEDVQVDPRPYALDIASVQTTLAPVEAFLSRCLGDDPAKPSSARVAMIVAGHGAIEGLLVTPTTLQGCMEPALRKLTFPATRLGRQHISHTVLPAAAPVVKPAAKPAGRPPQKAVAKPARAAPAGPTAP